MGTVLCWSPWRLFFTSSSKQSTAFLLSVSRGPNHDGKHWNDVESLPLHRFQIIAGLCKTFVNCYNSDLSGLWFLTGTLRYTQATLRMVSRLNLGLGRNDFESKSGLHVSQVAGNPPWWGRMVERHRRRDRHEYKIYDRGTQVVHFLNIIIIKYIINGK